MIAQSFVVQLVKIENADTQRSLSVRFEIGQLVNHATIATGYTTRRVILEYRKIRGDAAKCLDYYQSSARMDACFTERQKKVLLSKLVPVDAALALAAECHYADSERVGVIKQIQAGTIKAPWGRVKGSDCWKRQSLGFVRREIPISHAPVAPPEDDELNDETAVNIISNLFSRIKEQNRAEKIIKEVYQKLGWA